MKTLTIATLAAIACDTFTRGEREELIIPPWQDPQKLDIDGTGFDVRVAKALASRGYAKVRLSVIVEGGRENGMQKFEYENKFQHRWENAFGLPIHGKACRVHSIGLEAFHTRQEDACRVACGKQKDCKYYSFYGNRTCVLTETCELEDADAVTSRNYGVRTLYSSIIDVTPGAPTKVTVAGRELTILVPEEDKDTSGIIWADPCFDDRWKTCHNAKRFNMFQRSYELLNELGKDPSFHFFQILGDNFYDRDGSITRELFQKLSLQVKSKIFQTVAGNHDFWILGIPPGHRQYDQYGHGFMQFYAQDTIAAREHDLFDFSIGPDDVSIKTHHNLRNSHKNFEYYHKIGNLGFIGFLGASRFEDSKPMFEEACSYFSSTSPPAVIFILTHWNKPGDGCDNSMTAQSVRRFLLSLDGCNIGDRLKFIDGHTHCNRIQLEGQAEPVGFTIGGHGMLQPIPHNCNQDGFLFLQSSKTSVQIYYFENANIAKGAVIDNYDKIYDCVRHRSKLANCVEFAQLWLNSTF